MEKQDQHHKKKKKKNNNNKRQQAQLAPLKEEIEHIQDEFNQLRKQTRRSGQGRSNRTRKFEPGSMATEVAKQLNRATTDNPGADRMYTDWDQMLCAKHNPGRFACPYIMDMNYAAGISGIIRRQFAIAQAWGKTDTSGRTLPGNNFSTNLGTNRFTVILSCSSLSAFYGAGGEGTVPEKEKLAGFLIYDMASPDEKVVSPSNFDDANAGAAAAYTVADLYGTQGESISEHSFIWAQDLEFHLRGPAATESGTIHIGQFTMGSFGKAIWTTGSATYFSAGDLMNAATRTLDVKKCHGKFRLDTAVVTHTLANHTWCTWADKELESVGQEVVRFAVIESPFVSIAQNQAGQTLQYTIDVIASANYIMQPKIQDAWVNSLTQPEGMYRISVNGDEPISTVRMMYNPMYQGIRSGPIGKMVTHMMQWYNKNKSWVDPVGKLLFNAALSRVGLPILKVDHTRNYSKNSHMALLEYFIQRLQDDPTFSERYDIARMKSDYQALLEYSGRFFKIDDLPALEDKSFEIEDVQPRAATKKKS